MSAHRPGALLLAIAAVTLPAFAGDFLVAVDVPASIDGADYRPHQVVQQSSGAWSVLASLPEQVAIGALHDQGDGSWLVAPASPVTLDGTDYEPRDLFAWDGTLAALVLDGSTAGIPGYARIDAVAKDAAGTTVLSFDVPARLGAADYVASDLVGWDGTGFSLYRSGAAAGIPLSSNVVALGFDATDTAVVAFDVPTTVGTTTYVRGDLVDWSGTTLSLRQHETAWPPSCQMTALDVGGGGDGGASVSARVFDLRVSEFGDTGLQLSWSATCLLGSEDYAVYRGVIGDFASHAKVACSTDSATWVGTTIDATKPATYFLVVAHDGVHEGSYGTGSDRAERGGATTPCFPQSVGLPCP
jgi:hypothetical protein